MKTEERIDGFVTEIWSWYERHKRTLPWRDLAITDDTQRAYMVLVSEIMLQQTQVPRVIIIFKRFLTQFPTISDLARASNKEVILAWKGMGYNSRALRLRDAAKIIVDEYQGVFPKDMDQLLSIKGIGPYTAAAVRNFAFNLPTPCIDTNIRRILQRTFLGPDTGDQRSVIRDRELLRIADAVLKRAIASPFDSSQGKPPTPLQADQRDVSGEGRSFNAANWHAALMDFGSLVQTKTKPKWDVCPLTEKGIMKVTPKNFPESRKPKAESSKEPGRMMGSKYIPNRIFRGRIVDALREHHEGLTIDEIGSHICIDWSDEYHAWLTGLLSGLTRDGMVRANGPRYVLGN